MKVFTFNENRRKRYRAVYSAGEQILYTVEYRVKKYSLFGKHYYDWKEVASIRSTKKFDCIKHLLDMKIRDDQFFKAEQRRVMVNPFLEYQDYYNNGGKYLHLYGKDTNKS